MGIFKGSGVCLSLIGREPEHISCSNRAEYFLIIYEVLYDCGSFNYSGDNYYYLFNNLVKYYLIFIRVTQIGNGHREGNKTLILFVFNKTR